MTLIAPLILLLLAPVFPNPQSESWIDSPEAYFITAEEQKEWATIESRETREAFKERYWLRRDPTPGTAQNEFRETVLGRIRYADSAFGIEATPGSRTARGFLFVVFGSPARATQDYLSTPSPGQRGLVGMNEGNETIFRWTWDRERTPQLMDALSRPRFEVSVILEPTRRRDRIESPGLVSDFRDLLAAKSIVNPDLISASAAAPITEMVPLLAAADEGAWRATQTDSASVRPASAAVVFTPEGAPRTLVWGFEEGSSPKGSTFALRLTREGDETPTIWSGTAIPTRQLIASRPGTIWLATAELPPGMWSGQLDTTATAATPLQVAIPAEGEFAVSSLLIGGGPESGAPGDPLFAIGPALFRPRADSQFARSESLWYFLQFRGGIPDGMRLEPKLMKKGKGIVTTWEPFAPDLVAAGSNLQVAGYEVPLQTIEPGAYTLYVTIRAGVQSFVRRADFEVVER